MTGVKAEIWSVADDAELRELADQYPVVAKALRFCEPLYYYEDIPFFSILGYVPRLRDDKVSVSRRKLVRDNRPYSW